MVSENIPGMSQRQLAAFLTIALAAKIAPIIVSPPGCGKTSIIRQVAVQLGHRLIELHPATSEPTDFKGLPAIVDNMAVWLAYDELLAMLQADVATIVLIDDLGHADDSVQKALMQVVRGRIGEKVISEHVRFCAATNDRLDRAGVQGFIEPFKSSFHTIIRLIVENESWHVWAMNNNIHECIRVFLYIHPNYLHKFTPTSELENSPNPRIWEKLSDEMHAGFSDDYIRPIIHGTIGAEATQEFMPYYYMRKDIIDPAAVLLNPGGVDLPDMSHQDKLYMLTLAVARQFRITKNQTRTIAHDSFKFCDRLPMVFQRLYLEEIRANYKDSSLTGYFAQWLTDHPEITLTT